MYKNTRYREVLAREELDNLDLRDRTGFRDLSMSEIEASISICTALRAALPTFQIPTLSTILAHDDVSLDNILADSAGNLMALLDWESLALQPLVLIQFFVPLLAGEDLTSHYSSFNPRWPKCLDNKLDEYWRPEDDPYARLHDRVVGRIKKDPWAPTFVNIEDNIRTHLRPYYKEHLEELQCPLVKRLLYNEEGILEQLTDRVFFPSAFQNDTMDWLESLKGQNSRCGECNGSEQNEVENMASDQSGVMETGCKLANDTHGM